MLGDDHPDIGLSLGNVGSVYVALGEHAKALAFKAQALDVCLRVFGETHPDTATALSSLGAAHQHLGDHARALVLAQRSLEIRRSVLGDNHPDTASSFANVSAVETSLGHHKLALEHARRALDILTKVQGPEYSITLDTMLAVVDKWLNFKRPDSAYRLLESWLAELPLDHPRRAALTARLRALPVPSGRRQAPATSNRRRKRS